MHTEDIIHKYSYFFLNLHYLLQKEVCGTHTLISPFYMD